jgi:hypothetical protein
VTPLSVIKNPVKGWIGRLFFGDNIVRSGDEIGYSFDTETRVRTSIYSDHDGRIQWIPLFNRSIDEDFEDWEDKEADKILCYVFPPKPNDPLSKIPHYTVETPPEITKTTYCNIDWRGWKHLEFVQGEGDTILTIKFSDGESDHEFYVYADGREGLLYRPSGCRENIIHHSKGIRPRCPLFIIITPFSTITASIAGTFYRRDNIENGYNVTKGETIGMIKRDNEFLCDPVTADEDGFLYWFLPTAYLTPVGKIIAYIFHLIPESYNGLQLL